MSSGLRVRRWDLYWADLEPVIGHEQGGGTRPVLVVSNDGFNSRFPLATVLPLTKVEGKHRRFYPFEVLVPANAAGNPATSVVMPHQMRTVSTLRLKGRLGALLDPEIRFRIENRLLEHLDLQFEAETEF